MIYVWGVCVGLVIVVGATIIYGMVKDIHDKHDNF